MKQYIPITAEPHTPPYKIHKYFARRPWNLFSQLIETFSNSGDTILDPFMGGGVTIYEGLKLDRKTIGFDINPLSVFITKNMIKKVKNIKEFEITYESIKNYLKYLYSDYETFNYKAGQGHLFTNKVSIGWNELAFNVFCNYCGQKVLLSNDNKLRNGRYSCSKLQCEGNKKDGGFIEPKNCKRDGYKYLFSVIIQPETSKQLKISFNRERLVTLDQHLKFLRRELNKRKIVVPKDKIPLEWDRQFEDLLERKNIINFQDLFTEKNLFINLLLKDYLDKLIVDKSSYELFHLIFSSSLRDTNIMAFTNEFWQSGVPTTWSKHAYWIPSQFCEVNVLSAFERAYKRTFASLVYNSSYEYKINSADQIEQILEDKNFYLSATSLVDSDMPDNFVDAIITDPPYGSNVQYLELSHFWYVWNKDQYDVQQIDFSQEAVSNRKKNFRGAKSMYDYESNLSKVFSKCYKVLKPKKYMVLTFNNKDLSAWIAIVISILKAGFRFENLYFQDGVKNYKQTAHTKYDGSPFGDYIYVFRKSEKKESLDKKYSSQKDFETDLDKILSKHIRDFKKEMNNRNEVIKDMFLEAIPLIESFTESYLNKNKDHNLYSHFNKKYMDKMYE